MLRRDIWPEEKIERFKALYARGLCHSLIAQELGTTKNACIGKAHRLGLEARKVVTQRPRTVSRRGRKTLLRAYEFPHDPFANLPLETSPHQVSLANIGRCKCRWPLNDPGPDFLFCGADTFRESSYCIRHFRASIGIGKRRAA